jgi:hypothetical protein
VNRALFAPPQIVRHAEVPSGAVFNFAGRPLRVFRTYGSDPAAPVILEELAAFGTTLRGQLSIWSADAVMRALYGGGT